MREAQQYGLLDDSSEPGEILRLLAEPAVSLEHWGKRILRRSLLATAAHAARRIGAYADDPANTPFQLVASARRALADLGAIRTRWQHATEPIPPPRPRTPPTHPADTAQHTPPGPVASGDHAHVSTTPSTDAHVRLDTRPHHPSAVTATARHIAQAHLSVRGFEPVATDTLVMARIDHEEPYWAEHAARALTAEHITVEITPNLRGAIDDEWTSPDHPMSWCTRSEIREVSNEAQKIHDDIRHGRLIIHAHAHDGWTTKAIGTYRDGSSVILHGENHLRTVEASFRTAAEALNAFELLHGDAVRPGPAPQTDVERQADEARSTLTAALVKADPALPRTETVPAYAADPADHDAFVNEHGDWAKWRTWSDNTTHLIHESQTLRAELVHEPDPREAAWTFAAYETPVSDRMWHLTLTAAAPGPLLQSLLISPAFSSMSSPPRTPAFTSPPGPCGPAPTSTAPPGPSTLPATPPSHS